MLPESGRNRAVAYSSFQISAVASGPLLQPPAIRTPPPGSGVAAGGGEGAAPLVGERVE